MEDDTSAQTTKGNISLQMEDDTSPQTTWDETSPRMTSDDILLQMEDEASPSMKDETPDDDDGLIPPGHPSLRTNAYSGHSFADGRPHSHNNVFVRDNSNHPPGHPLARAVAIGTFAIGPNFFGSPLPTVHPPFGLQWP
jgi:hypothetical protein